MNQNYQGNYTLTIQKTHTLLQKKQVMKTKTKLHDKRANPFGSQAISTVQ